MEKELDLKALLNVMLHRLWIILLAGVVAGLIGYGYTKYAITSTYTSSVTLYVNSTSNRTSAGGAPDFSTSERLLSTYIVILQSDNVLSEVIRNMNLQMTTGQLRSMISATSVNQTEVLKINVTHADKQFACDIANAVAQYAPPEIIRVVKAGSVEIIDNAKPASYPNGPNASRNTAIAAMAGIIMAIGVIFLLEMFNTTIRTEEDITQNYKLPILGSIPDFMISQK